MLRRRPVPRHGPARRGRARSPACGTSSRPSRERMRLGPMAVLHAIVDTVVDTYRAIDEEIANDLDDIEAQVFSGGPMDSTVVYRLKREVLEFRRAAAPLALPLPCLLQRRGLTGDGSGASAAVPRRVGPPAGGHRPRGVLRPAPHRHRGGPPGPGDGAAEQRHAQDLGLGGDRRRADDDRGHLRHELRPHARAAVALRVLRRPRPHGAVCLSIYRGSSAAAGCRAADPDRPPARRSRHPVRSR